MAQQNTGQQTQEQTTSGQDYYSDRSLHWLRGKQLKDFYKDLLQVSTGANTGVTTTNTAISDGEATDSKLKLSWLEADVSAGMQIGGTAVTATSAQINTLDGWGSGLGNVKFALDSKLNAIGTQTDKVMVCNSGGTGIEWKTGAELRTALQLGTASQKSVSASTGNAVSWKSTDFYNNNYAFEGNWSGMVVTTDTTGRTQTASPDDYKTKLGLSSTSDAQFGDITVQSHLIHNGLFTGSSEVGYTIPASGSTDGYLYYYRRVEGNNINEYRLVFVIQDGANSYASHVLIEKNISGSGGQPPPE